MKKIIEILKAIIAKLCKPVQVEVKVSSEKVETTETPPTPATTEKVEIVSKPAKKIAKATKVAKVAKDEKVAKRRGRPRKVKVEWFFNL